MMNEKMKSHGHFHEALAIELPSPVPNYLAAPQIFQQMHPPTHRTDGAAVNLRGRHESVSRMATEYHAVSISIDNTCIDTRGGMDVTTQYLPGGENPERSCIAHSYLPLGYGHDGGFMEAFILILNDKTKEGGNGIVCTEDTRVPHSSSASSLYINPNSTSVTTISTLSSNPQLDDSRKSVETSMHKQAGSTLEFCVILRGLLPGYGDEEVGGKEIINRSGSESKSPSFKPEHIQDECEKGEITDTNKNTNEYQKIGRKSKKKPKNKRQKERFNVYQSFSLSFVPSSVIKLCQTETEVEIEENEPSGIKSGMVRAKTFTLFLADNSELKMYIIQPLSRPPVQNTSAGNNEKFKIKECAIPPQRKSDEVPNSNLEMNDFISLLLQTARTSGNGAAESPLLFPSPVTAVAMTSYDYHMEDCFHPVNCLAVGCQDGTIRVVSYMSRVFGNDNVDDKDVREQSRTKNLSFEVCDVSEFVIDGSISSLTFSHRDDRGAKITTLLAGSICGFACYFVQSKGENFGFYGAFPIIDGLWNAKINDEDGVLSVCDFQYGGVHDGIVVALGLFSGRLLLLKASNMLDYDIDEDESIHRSCHFDCIYHVTFPYPICNVQALTSGIFTDMVICTRRSLHLLRSNPELIADATFERLERLLRKHRTKSPISSSIRDDDISDF